MARGRGLPSSWGSSLPTDHKQVQYLASKTAWDLHKDRDTFVKALMGPIGSGKSVACCWDLFQSAHEQAPASDGIRYTRFAVIRNTYRELQDTTMQTWFDWFPKTLGNYIAGDMKHIIQINDIHMEVLFRALDKPEDIKKLLSLELTKAWVNEAREIPKAVIDALLGRVGRYPSKRDTGPSKWGIIMDTNPPDNDHWWYRLFEEEKPEDWKLWKQPPGLLKRNGKYYPNPKAENIHNLPEGYYQRMLAGKDEEWINVYIMGQYGFIKDGKPVYPEYVDAIHCPSEEIKIVPGRTKIIGLDFGLTPAAVFLQEADDGQLQAVDELVTEDMGTVRFADMLNERIRTVFRGCPVEVWGDPAGEGRSQVDERTPFDILRAANIRAFPAPTNDFTLRREGVARKLTQLTIGGRPGLAISPRCRMLRKAMAGGYKFRRLQVSGDERYVDKPDKNMYSHVAEALQYGISGGGGTRELLHTTDRQMRTNYRAKRSIGG